MGHEKLAGLSLSIVGLLSAVGPVRADDASIIYLTARRFEFSPAEIEVKKGVPVELELRSLDRTHGFNLPAFGVRREIPAGEVVRVRFVPDKAGRFAFVCDLFCGSGHEEMQGVLKVRD